MPVALRLSGKLAIQCREENPEHEISSPLQAMLWSEPAWLVQTRTPVALRLNGLLAIPSSCKRPLASSSYDFVAGESPLPKTARLQAGVDLSLVVSPTFPSPGHSAFRRAGADSPRAPLRLAREHPVP